MRRTSKALVAGSIGLGLVFAVVPAAHAVPQRAAPNPGTVVDPTPPANASSTAPVPAPKTDGVAAEPPANEAATEIGVTTTPSGSDSTAPTVESQPETGPAPPPTSELPAAPPAPRLPSVRTTGRTGAGKGLRPPPRSSDHLGLERLEDGSFVHRDPGGRFTARIMADGRVRLADRWRRPTPPGDPRSDRGRCCGRPPEGVGRALNPMKGIPASGPAEWALVRGPRQVHAEAKARFLRRTEAFRVQLAVADYRAQIERQLSSLPAELSTLWASPELSLARKRALLFSRWDDCDERIGALRLDTVSGPDPVPAARPSIDALRLDAAARARRAIETFIRTHAPEGSAAAFPASELQQLNARRYSAETFSPYRPAVTDDRPEATDDSPRRSRRSR